MWLKASKLLASPIIRKHVLMFSKSIVSGMIDELVYQASKTLRKQNYERDD